MPEVTPAAATTAALVFCAWPDAAANFNAIERNLA
jgi:hypothetical protein